VGPALAPGAIACAPGSPERWLLVEAAGPGHFLAAPYPLDPARPLMAMGAGPLAFEGSDEASARVLSLRHRTRAAAVPSRGSGTLGTAMVLCAGLGTRLRPLTVAHPKPALPFFGGPLLRASFALLAGAGVRRAVINTHHLPEAMAQTAEREAARFSLELRISHEPVLQGTAGGVRDARRLLGDEPFILLNGDAFMAFDLKALVAEHQQGGNAATLAVAPMPPGEAFGALEATPDGAMRGVAPAGRFTSGLVPWHFIGAHVIEPSVFDSIPASGECDIHRAAYPAMLARGLRVRVCPVALGAWADLGTPGRYVRAAEEVLTGLCDLSSLGEGAPVSETDAQRLRSSPCAERRWIAPSAQVSPLASLEQVVVGAECSIGAARVRRAAVLPGTRIADGERLEGAIASGKLRVAAE
jgi:mannose-1-phosphate guanylyltransferase